MSQKTLRTLRASVGWTRRIRQWRLPFTQPRCVYHLDAALCAARRLQFFQTTRYFLSVLAAVERGKTKVAFPLRAKSSTRGNDHV